MNQEELVKRLRAKDIMAFERLYEMYWKNICGVVNTIVKDESLAEEIAQDVFTKVWNDSHHFNPSKGRFFTWLLNIARKAAINQERLEFDENDKKDLTSNYFLGVLNTKNRGNTLNDDNGIKKLAKNIQRKNIEIVDLLYFKGHTPQQTAEALDIPLGRIKKRNRNCISRIRKNMTFEWM